MLCRDATRSAEQDMSSVKLILGCQKNAHKFKAREEKLEISREEDAARRTDEVESRKRAGHDMRKSECSFHRLALPSFKQQNLNKCQSFDHFHPVYIDKNMYIIFCSRLLSRFQRLRKQNHTSEVNNTTRQHF